MPIKAHRLRDLSVHLLVLVASGSLGGCASMGTPRVIYLARHGQTDWNRVGRFQGDPDLDTVGYVNRLSLWMLLRDRPLDSIYTSELLRTQRTAEPLAMQKKLRVQPRAELNEVDAGVMAGVCFSELHPGRARGWDQLCQAPSRGSRPEVTMEAVRRELGEARKLRLEDRMPLGENYYDVAKRVAPFIEELRRGARDREVLVIGHGIVNRAFLHHMLGWPLEAVSSIRQENDQVYRLETDEAGTVLRLSLYTPGHGWKACSNSPPRAGQRELDCNPGAAPSSQPAPFTPPP